MAGFPDRVSFEQLGGEREPAGKITNPKKQVGHDYFNDVGWQVAGMNRVSCLATFEVSAIGERESGGEVWNQRSEDALRILITHPNTGEYVFTAQASAYPDWSGTPRAVIFAGAIVTPRCSVGVVRVATFERNSATQITARLFNALAAFAAVDGPFAIDIK